MNHLAQGARIVARVFRRERTTHHSLHDIAALRAINNIQILVPADNFEARCAVRAAALSEKPAYLRFGKAPLFDLPRTDDDFAIGKARIIREGTDIAFIATGETVIHALLAAERLADSKISAKVISVPTVRPLDHVKILATARQCRAIVTVEEHFIHGGLGEAVAALLMQAGEHPRFLIVGIPDEYTVTGTQADIFRHYGISMEGLSRIAGDLLSEIKR